MLETAGMFVAAICLSDSGSAVISTCKISMLLWMSAQSKLEHVKETHGSRSCLFCSDRISNPSGRGAGVITGNTAPCTIPTAFPKTSQFHPLSECMYARKSECSKENSNDKSHIAESQCSQRCVSASCLATIVQPSSSGGHSF
jgi:hypothetical protein